MGEQSVKSADMVDGKTGQLYAIVLPGFRPTVLGRLATPNFPEQLTPLGTARTLLEKAHQTLFWAEYQTVRSQWTVENVNWTTWSFW